jgi:hypothetical protein
MKFPLDSERGVSSRQGQHQQTRGGSLAFVVGKRVVAESESTSRRPRHGIVEEVVRGDPSPRYRIKWDDGHESILTAAGGALRAELRGRKEPSSAARGRTAARSRR